MKKHLRKTSPHLSDIAKAAGVSKMTVSRAFNRPDLLNESTLSRVKEKAKEMGYIPDLAASGFITGATRIIGVVLPSLSDMAYAESLAGINEAADQYGFNIIVGESRFCIERERKLLMSFVGRKVEGLVLLACSSSSYNCDIVNSLSTPLLSLWDLPESTPSIVNGFCNEKAGRLVAEHFVKQKKAELLVATSTFYRDLQRAEGFLAFAKKVKVSATMRSFSVTNDDTELMFKAGKNLIDELIKSGSLPDAIFFTDESAAFGALQEAKQYGLRKEQLSICGFGNTLFAKYAYPSLSTVDIAAKEMGLNGTLRLIDKIKGDKTLTDTVEHDTTLIIRDSG